MDDWNTFLLDLYDTAQAASPIEFVETALASSRRYIEFDSSVVVDLSRSTSGKLQIQTIHLDKVPIERLSDRQKLFDSEVVEANGVLKSRDETLAKAFGYRGRSVAAAYHGKIDQAVKRYCRRYETAQSLAFVNRAGGLGTTTAAALWRSNPNKPYQMQDLQTANLLLPHLFQGRALNNRLVSQAPALSSHMALLATFDGRLHFADNAAIALLQQEWPEWHPPILPPQLMQALYSDIGRDYKGRALAIQARVEGSLLWLTVRLVSSLNSLSAAELRVARFAAEGAQYKEIAKHLGVSPATVRNQLHAVYRKLGVKNKTTLAAVLR